MSGSSRTRLLLAVAALLSGCAAPPPPAPAAGTVVFDTVHSEALAGNPLGDPVDRELAVYLPPGYERTERRYPVVYLLHGFDGDARQFLGPRFAIARGLDSLIHSGAVRPMLVVMPDARNALGGAFQVNSPATGRWEEHLVDEVVAHVDGRYRTVAAAEGRAVAGWSMGGYGALAVAAEHPDRFSAVYALSPCCLGRELLDDIPPDHPAWSERISLAGPASIAAASFHARLLWAATAALGPGAPLPPTPAAWRAAPDVAQRAEAAEPNLRRLRAIGFDAGRGDGFSHIPTTTRRLAAALTRAGIPHRFEEYDGGHGDRVPERLRQVALPFLSEALEVRR